jgi:hypothetical protein
MLSDPKRSPARSSKPLCLSNVASMVLSIIEKAATTTFSGVADQIVAAIGPAEAGSASEQRTLRRRVYDVLNVFCAVGLVTKDSKGIAFQQTGVPRLRASSDAAQQAKARLAVKEGVLVEKANMLLSHRLLIERNQTRRRPPTAVQLPSIFVAFSNAGRGEIKRALDGGKLEIVAESPPMFFSPMNIFHTMRFGVESQIACVRAAPELAALESLLFPRGPLAPAQAHRGDGKPEELRVNNAR